MTPFQYRPFGEHELRLGWASWDKDHTEISVKYCWQDSRGRISRGGEVPVKSLPGMLAMAVQSGHLKAKDIEWDDLKMLAEFFNIAKRKLGKQEPARPAAASVAPMRK